MTDHKKQAQRYIDDRYLKVAEDAELAVSLAVAQVHATLYLAEQQRIANLIAFEGPCWTSPRGETYSVAEMLPNATADQIREGLGL